MPTGLALLAIAGPDGRPPALAPPRGATVARVGPEHPADAPLPPADVVVTPLDALRAPRSRARLERAVDREGRASAVLAVVDDARSAGERAAAAIAALPRAELAFADDLTPEGLPPLVERALARAHGSSGSHGPGEIGGAPGPVAPERRGAADRRDAERLALRLLDELRVGVSPLGDLGRALHAAVRTVRAVLDADLATIAERDGDRLRAGASCRRLDAAAPEPLPEDASALDAALEDVGLAACRARGPVLRRLPGGAVFAASLALPEASLCLLVRLPAPPSTTTLGLAVKAAAQLRIVLGHASLHASAERELARSKAMLEIGDALNGQAPLDETIESVCRTVARTLDARRVLFYQVDVAGERIVRSAGFASPEAARPRSGDAGDASRTGAASDAAAACDPRGLLDIEALRGSLGWRCMAERRAVLVPRGAPHAGEADAEAARRLPVSIGSTLIAPLSDPAAPALEGALIAIRDPDGHDFLRADLETCRQIARRLAVLVHRRELQERMEELALNDPLTGLANRAALEIALDRRVERARGLRRVRSFAVVFMDLDGFKHVNDSLGHETGDRLLEAVAGRLGAETRPGDTLARLGGDEFAMVLDPVTGPGDAVRIARRVLDTLQAPFDVDGQRLSIGASIGVSVYPRHARNPSSLVRTADAAMYDAKRGGKNAVRCFDEALAEGTSRRLELERALRESVAAAGAGLSLVYQPQVSLETGLVTGVEALMRWRHPTLGEVGPDEFVPVAEDARLIGPMSLWLLDRACDTLARLVARAEAAGGARAPCLAVNVSSPTLEDDAFVDAVEARLSGASLDPGLLCVELTESVVVSGAPEVVARIERLRRIGVRLSVDDFGTGWSSLRYLLGLPLDALKIDRTFVQHVVDDAEHERLVRTLLSMARSLGLSTVAEGIETPAQHRALARAGCTAAQGWLYARPLSPDALVAFLDAHDPATVTGAVGRAA